MDFKEQLRGIPNEMAEKQRKEQEEKLEAIARAIHEKIKEEIRHAVEQKDYRYVDGQKCVEGVFWYFDILSYKDSMGFSQTDNRASLRFELRGETLYFSLTPTAALLYERVRQLCNADGIRLERPYIRISESLGVDFWSGQIKGWAKPRKVYLPSDDSKLSKSIDFVSTNPYWDEHFDDEAAKDPLYFGGPTRRHYIISEIKRGNGYCDQRCLVFFKYHITF